MTGDRGIFAKNDSTRERKQKVEVVKRPREEGNSTSKGGPGRAERNPWEIAGKVGSMGRRRLGKHKIQKFRKGSTVRKEGRGPNKTTQFSTNAHSKGINRTDKTTERGR